MVRKRSYEKIAEDSARNNRGTEEQDGERLKGEGRGEKEKEEVEVEGGMDGIWLPVPCTLRSKN